MEFGPNEEPVAGSSGWLLVSGDDLAVLVDSRYTVQARREAPLATALDYGSDAGETIGRWLVAHGVRRCGLDPQAVRHAVWERIAATATGVELVPVKGFGGVQRARKEPAEIERITAACAVADRALARLLPQIRPGVTEAALAWSLERGMREDGAEALAFDVAADVGRRPRISLMRAYSSGFKPSSANGCELSGVVWAIATVSNAITSPSHLELM
jgi:Xaa-Pro aminopeptidase